MKVTISAVKVLAATLVLVCSSANASSVIVFNALLDGQQANAGLGTGSPGSGAGTMTLATDSNVFSWFVAWQDLLAPVTVAHFHGPAAPDQNAGVQVAIDVASNPSSGSAVLTDDQVTDLLAGLWYVNIHSSAFPGGEIRGQVLRVGQIPVPPAIWLFGSAVFGMVALRRRRTG
jgi:hypothetical protein